MIRVFPGTRASRPARAQACLHRTPGGGHRRWIFAFAALLACIPALSTAHHSFAMFDRDRTLVISGVVREFQWTNPHTWIQVTVTDAAGKQTEWSLEGGSPGILSRNGWKRTSLQAGEKVTIEIYPLKSGEPGGSFIEVTKADGTKLYYHG